jgi:peptidyl-prolyl cis-trans isomerase A (cyclophilin A)
MFKRVLLIGALLTGLVGASAAHSQEKKGPLYATFKTSMGDIVIQLFEDKAPKTVANFVGLATGTKEWVDPKTGEKVKKPLYNGTIFHPDLRHTKGGILSMANAGPNTNGSQFFITLAPTLHLDNRHSVFGELVKGQEVVVAIGNAPRGANDRPLKEIVLKEVVISRGSY